MNNLNKGESWKKKLERVWGFKMKLSDIAKITMGQSPSSKDVYDYPNGIALLNGPTEFTDFSPIPKQYTNAGKKFSKNGDILFCVRGSTAGRMNFSNQTFAIGRGLAAISGYNGYTTEFIRVILENKLPDILNSATGSTFPNISRNQLLNIEIKNIDPNKANNIGLFYKSIYRKIELNTQTNQTLEQIAQAIFKHWFIDFAPVHAKANALARGETTEQAELAAMACLSGKTAEKITALKAQDPTAYHQLQQTAAAFPSEFVETEIGQVPKGWEVLKFKDFVKETKEKVGKLQGIEEYSVGNEGIYPRKEKYKKQLAKDPSKNKLIREANIVFGMGNKEVNWGIMRDKIGSVSSAYNIFQINDINHLFLDMFINNIPYYFRDIIKPTSRQGQTIDKEAFLEKAIYYPNKEIINIFLEKITQINELSICIKSQNIYLLSIRDYLLPKLLGGEIKL